MTKSLIDNKTNTVKLQNLIKHLQGYLSKDHYGTLFLSVDIQDGIIQNIKVLPVAKKDVTIIS